MSARFHDHVKLLVGVVDVPAGTTGTVVIVYPDGSLEVELDDLGLAPTPEGSIGVASDDVEVVRRWEQPRRRSAA